MTNITKELNSYLKKLTEEEKGQLTSALKKQLILAEAKRLSSFTVRKSISIREVVKAVRIVRTKKNAA